ncbi:MAG: GW dipeptide domain-containing protein [Holosporales bacterium]|jgi:SH3-like domain-containing protein|nr:GW dipeptide domain-containing protein [Holosporales bacterium]
MSIKANKVNAHVGPGKDYRIKFEYILKGLPVIVVAKYDNWFKIEDPDRDYGWLHKSLLSPERFVISRNQDVAPIMSNSNDSSNIIARVSRNVVMKLRSIRGNWCKVELNYDGKKISGWINRGNVFGIMNNEG